MILKSLVRYADAKYQPFTWLGNKTTTFTIANNVKSTSVTDVFWYQLGHGLVQTAIVIMRLAWEMKFALIVSILVNIL